MQIKEMLDCFSHPISTGKTVIPITISMGAVEITTDGTDKNTLLTKADRAMYKAKTFNANRVIYHTPLPSQIIGF